jgi:hypothetical protein
VRRRRSDTCFQILTDPLDLRSEGATLVFASFFGNSIAYSAPVNVGLQSIGWKFYMIFVAVTTISTTAIWFTFPEVCLGRFQNHDADLTSSQTMGLPLEEINAKFGEKVEIDLKSAVAQEKEQARSKPNATENAEV